MGRFWKIVTLAMVTAMLAACGAASGETGGNPADQKLRVVTTTGMIADIAQNVGGERVEVTALMGPGVDPHLYRASEGDVRRLEEADVVLYNGLHLEAQMGRVLEQMGERTTVAVTDGIDRDKLLTPAEFQGNYDPHVWFDVTLWMKAAEEVRDTLIVIDPGQADTYRTNADQYLSQLRELDGYVREQAQRIPEDKRVIVTAHDAFNYFGRAYGFEVRGLQGISTAAEAGTADVQNMAGFIAERQIPAIFVESSVSPRAVEALQKAVRARGQEVAIGGQLYSDAMGDPGTPDGTYVGMVRHNIDTIVSALSG